MSDSYDFAAYVIVESVEIISEKETVSDPDASFYNLRYFANYLKCIFITILK